jgi:hypothetical protein
MTRFTYTIDDNNAVSIFDTENPNEGGAPFTLQPWHPDTPGESWTAEEAAAWAETAIAERDLEPIEYVPESIKEVRAIMEAAGETPLV